MENVTNNENRSVGWWKNLALRLAYLFAAVILIFAGIGIWFGGEMHSLRNINETTEKELAGALRSNETCTQENTELKQIAKTRLEIVEELKAQNYELTVRNNKLAKDLELKTSRN